MVGYILIELGPYILSYHQEETAEHLISIVNGLLNGTYLLCMFTRVCEVSLPQLMVRMRESIQLGSISFIYHRKERKWNDQIVA